MFFYGNYFMGRLQFSLSHRPAKPLAAYAAAVYGAAEYESCMRRLSSHTKREAVHKPDPVHAQPSLNASFPCRPSPAAP